MADDEARRAEHWSMLIALLSDFQDRSNGLGRACLDLAMDAIMLHHAIPEDLDADGQARLLARVQRARMMLTGGDREARFKQRLIAAVEHYAAEPDDDIEASVAAAHHVALTLDDKFGPRFINDLDGGFTSEGLKLVTHVRDLVIALRDNRRGRGHAKAKKKAQARVDFLRALGFDATHDGVKTARKRYGKK